MATTRVLATALPYSLAHDATFHLSVFFSHRLDPAGTLADFPDAAHWVDTLLGGHVELLLPGRTTPVPTVIVSAPDESAWEAAFPGSTPVEGFPHPSVTDDPWASYPAHTADGYAVDTHLASALAYPLAPPAVDGNPVIAPVFQHLMEHSPAVRRLFGSFARDRATRDQQLRQDRLNEALASLGQSRRGSHQRIRSWQSAVDVLLEDTEMDERITGYLDSLLDEDLSGADPALRMLRDTHAARRYYQRPEEQRPYRPEPDEGATQPRPPRPAPDFHARAGALGTTPALLRRLGLVVDLRVDDHVDRADLAGAAWVAARFVPPDRADVVRIVPPRTRCVSDGDAFCATASDRWSGGALPLGDPERYVVLDLDPDASALGLEQHLRALPRALASELNGDAAGAAPKALRSGGFAIAQVDRVDATRQRVEGAAAVPVEDDSEQATPASFGYDELVRGLRLEVWDDVTGAWHSLHARRVDASADGTTLLAAADDEGFLQVGGLNRSEGAGPYRLHEVLAGWEGWSLSAPRPGKVVVHAEDGTEQVLDEPPDQPVGPVHVTTSVAPGSLPWLRYGREYSFRLRGVDLAGNSVPRPAAHQGDSAAVEAADRQLTLLRDRYADRDQHGLLGQVRDDVLHLLPDETDDGDELARLAESVVTPVATTATSTPPATPRLPALAMTGARDIDRQLAARLTSALGERVRATTKAASATSTVPITRKEIRAAVGRLARTTPRWRVRPQLQIDPARFADIDDTSAPVGATDAPPVVTTPRPFLRWSPVPAPVLVARKALTVGESLARLVIRTDPTSPDSGPGPTSERHVLPPKTSQFEAELHGRFDFAFGAVTETDRQRAFAWALRERGTLTDEWIADLDHEGELVQQPNIALLSRPGADTEHAVTLDQITAHRDTPLGEGQYVVHDVDELRLPYLPDPLARGIALVFLDAGSPHSLPEPRVLQAVVVPFTGSWPALRTYRLVLTGGEELGARVDGNQIRVTVPAGEQVRVAVSSSLDEEDLQVLGLWRSHPVSAPDDPDTPPDAKTVAARALLRRAAVAGWTWWLTPAEELRLVHAVPRPVHPPQLLSLRVLLRPAGLTVAALAGVVDVHGPSTERLTLVARWSEWVDDLAADGPLRVDRTDVVTQSPVGADERYGLLWLADMVVPGGDGEVTVQMHRALHTFSDTHARRVTYAARGTTRYQEFFAPAELPPPEDPTLLGAPREVVVQSSARPAAPQLGMTLPLLLWEEGTEPDQPFAYRRTRRSGLRLWLRRPWYSSGDGELLAVVISESGEDPADTISLWGRDPTLATGTVASATRPPLVRPADLALQVVGALVVERPGRPVTGAVPVTLVDLDRKPRVQVFGYRPEYHPERQEWFVDVALDPGDSLWPFVRLAVARYQPDSIADAELSPVALTDWVQPLPERTTTVSRPDAEHVQVTVTGPVALRGGEDPPGDTADAISTADRLLLRSRAMHATLQRAPKAGGSDLEWTDGPRVRLPLVGGAGLRCTWSAQLELPEPISLATPGESATWRILVEEVEFIEADPREGSNRQGTPSTASRLVYADYLAL